ncbi:hypothetical protein [Mycoplasma parvum]|uniref:Uncharacterized protein n=1 Tax=Mycoplasma parvum str. Indiana TaxID=1403316 RepID=U5NCC2_9MOLU|nr:hypothetical protein [Mycoplasma parvum]AGX89072.1 hypothetical protein PRV_01575 [Mycoplasma parvum str. Indiana]
MPCNFLSLSEFYENWEKLSQLKEETKFLLPTNWELIYSLLLELQKGGKLDKKLPDKEKISKDSLSFKEWKFQIRQILLSLIEYDYRRLLEKYNKLVFTHPASKLSYKAAHPEEIKNKTRPIATLADMKNLNSFLNRKLDILPLFFNSKDTNLEIFNSWKIDSLGKETSFKYNENLIKEWEEKDPNLFDLSSFKEPILPTL